MMESVRFSIIENNLHWENETKPSFLLDGIESEPNNVHDDASSISSESSCCEDYAEANRKFYKKPSFDWISRHSLQDSDGGALKELPHSESVLDHLAAGNWECIAGDAERVNTALLLSIFMANVDAVKRLLDNHHGADVNFADKNGRTTLHWACSLGNVSITKLLIERGANVNQWDANRKFAPLHLAAIAGSAQCIRLLLDAGANVNAGIETRSALHLAIEKNAIDCVDMLLRNKANPNTPQVYTETALHTAAALGNFDCMTLLLAHGADVRSLCGKRRMTALHLVAESGYAECVKLLLEHGADANVRNVENKTPLHLACLSQCGETVEILIKHGADVNAAYNDGRTALHAAIVNESKCLECTKSLLLAGANANQADSYGYTPLHIAALNESSGCALLLIDYGADITARTHGGVSALSFIVRRTPDVIPKYLNKLDASIKVNEHEIGDVDCEIKLDLRLLVPNPERGETELLLAFIEVGQKRVLKHPLCETFLFLKWHRIRKFFLFSLCYHAIYVLLFSFLIHGIYEKECPYAEPTLLRAKTQNPCDIPGYVASIGHVVIFMNLILLAKEFFQMGHGFIGYIKYWENWVQLTIICGVFFCAKPSTLFSGSLTNVPEWQYHVAAIVIFLVWLELMMIVGRFPVFGLYVQMFTKVAMNFAKFLLAYSCLLIAFGLSFGVVFNSYPAFKTVPWTLLKTITMMSGELEFEDIFYGDYKIQFPGTSHVLFFAFVVLVTIILMNLLVGLAVSDIQGLQDSAGLDRLTRQAELVAHLESIFFSRLLRKIPFNFMRILQRSALLRTSRYHLQFNVRPNDPRDKRLPKDLILSIYKLVAERRDRNMSIKRRRREQNFSSFVEQNLSNVLTSEGVRLRSHLPLSAGNCTVAPSNRPHSVDTNQSTKVRGCHSLNLIEIDFKMRTIANQLNDVTNKLQNMQDSISKHFDAVNRQINVLRHPIQRDVPEK